MAPAPPGLAAPRFRVGTSGYNYPEWKGAFYPEGLATGKMLPYYAERFSTVEINYTFYRLPNAKTVAGWTAATPDDFTFALKASQKITHFQRLKQVEDPVRYFCDTARLLGGKLGPLLFQLPPNFKKDMERLGGVLDLLPPDLRVAFEFRHPTWFDEEVYGLLRRRHVALCIVDHEEGATPAVATADWGYFRLRAVEYSAEALARWAGTIRELFAAGGAFVYFKHEDGATGPPLARKLSTLLTGRR
jgi:uncharacterized protein YecE (DUF72 family)